jgi:hypothetical protein
LPEPAAASTVDELAQTADFVFSGVVTKPGTSTVSMVEEIDHVAVVGIERVLRAPAYLGLDKGSEVTVRSERPDTLKRGTHAIFFCAAWLFAEGIALRELAHLDAPPAEEEAVAKQLADVERAQADRDLVARAGGATTVVAATVVAVGEIVAGGGQALLPDAKDDDPEPPGGDDAVARRVELAVDEHVSGAKPGDKLEVDVWLTGDPRWSESPLLRKGARGLWLLHGSKGRLQRGPLLLTERENYRPLADLKRLQKLQGGDR